MSSNHHRPTTAVSAGSAAVYKTTTKSVLKKWFHQQQQLQEEEEEEEKEGKEQDGILLLDRILLLDGGVSTHLESLIMAKQQWIQQQQHQQQEHQRPFQYRELWSSSLLLEDGVGPTLILQGHEDWLNAGCHVISTVTYQLHYFQSQWPVVGVHLTEQVMTDLFHKGLDLAQQAVAAAKAAAAQPEYDSSSQRSPAFVVASLGCFGAALANGAEYTGDYAAAAIAVAASQDSSEEEDMESLQKRIVLEFHRRKFLVVCHHQPAVDAVAFETVPSMIECRALRDLLLLDDTDSTTISKTASSSGGDSGGCCCWISLACKNETQLNDGTPLNNALQFLLEEIPSDKLTAIGLNCCHAKYLSGGLVDILIRALYKDYQQQQQQQQQQQCYSKTVKPPFRRGMVLYPNSGEEWDATSSTWLHGTGSTPVAMADYLISIVQQIDTTWAALCQDEDKNNNNSSSSSSPPPPPRLLLGGCCRTTTATLHALSQRVQDYLQAEKQQQQQQQQQRVIPQQQ